MFTTNQERSVPDHPAMLLTLATLLGLLASTLLAADAEPQSAPPRLLPPDAVAASKPMPVPTEETSTDTLWQVIEDHQAGRWADAIAAWQRVDLPCESEAWRWLGQGGGPSLPRPTR